MDKLICQKLGKLEEFPTIVGFNKRLTLLEDKDMVKRVQRLEDDYYLGDKETLTVEDMKRASFLSDLQRLLLWCGISAIGPLWDTWWSDVQKQNTWLKITRTSAILTHQIIHFTTNWHKDLASISLEQVTLELATMVTLFDQLMFPEGPKEKLQDLLNKVFKKKTFTIRWLLEEWNDVWPEDCNVRLSVLTFGGDEVNSVMDTSVRGWHSTNPPKYTKLTPTLFPENFRDVFCQGNIQSNTTGCLMLIQVTHPMLHLLCPI